MSTCWPWFHAQYTALDNESWTGKTIPGNCGGVDAYGNIPCTPESMRAYSEGWLAQNAPQALVMIGGRLSLALYTLARYMEGEVGSGTVEERVAVGEAAIGRKSDVVSLLLYRQPTTGPTAVNRGWYGPIHGVGTGTATAPYGRWATTSKNPTIMTLLLAHLALSGASGNFARDADDQDGPEAWISKGQASLDGYVRGLASNGKYWVGPLPGVDHWHTFLQFTPDLITRAARGPALLQRGLAALQLPRTRQDWSDVTSSCGKPFSASFSPGVRNSAVAFFVASIGLVAGSGVASLIARRYLHPR